jgi:glycosyltransferase involved in cell wall biosynthesis
MVKNKVLFILHLPAPIHGAAMVGKFIKDSKVINSSFDADFINLSTSTNMKSLRRGGIGKLLTALHIQYKVLKAIINKQYDLLYMTLTATGPGFYKDLFIVALLKLFRKRVIFHFHNKGISTRQENKLDNLLYQFAFKNTQSILLSPHLYFDIEKYVKKENVFFCANGIPVTAGDSVTSTQPTDPNHPCRILFLSNMVIEKGVLILLQACKILKEKGLVFECHFVGEWVDITPGQFEILLSNYGLTEYVFAHGKKYDEDKAHFFTHSDVFVFPTFYHNECFPLVLLEAMAYGLPVVSTLEGGIPDIVIESETGFLVQQKCATALSEKIELLIKQPQLRIRLGRAGKSRFVDFFMLEIFENNLAKILQRAAGNYS